jgi:hypothetical protein
MSEYSIRRTDENGGLVDIRFINSTASSPTFSALTVNNSISANTISATTYYGDGSNLLGLDDNPALNTAFVNVTGDTMSGNLTINANLTKPSNLSGRTYFDVDENALSYFPKTTSNDVTINIGQEAVIRVHNNTGQQINNGQACHITSQQPSVNGRTTN